MPLSLSATDAVARSLGLNQLFLRSHVKNAACACSGVRAKPITNSGGCRPVSSRENSSTYVESQNGQTYDRWFGSVATSAPHCWQRKNLPVGGAPGPGWVPANALGWMRLG